MTFILLTTQVITKSTYSFLLPVDNVQVYKADICMRAMVLTENNTTHFFFSSNDRTKKVMAIVLMNTFCTVYL